MALKEHYVNLNEGKADMCFEALEYIREHGWATRTWEDANGAVCLEGAINRITFCNLIARGKHGGGTGRSLRKSIPIQLQYLYDNLMYELQKHLEKEGYGSIPSFNDDALTSQEMVEKFLMQRGEYYEQRYLEGLRS